MTTQAIAEIDNLIQILEAEIPANPNSPDNSKLAKRLQKELADYFKSLELAFDYASLEALYYRHMKESLSTETDDILDPVLATLKANLVSRLNGHMVTIYLKGSAEMVSWGKTKQLGLPILYEGPPIDEAITWASKHCAKLVTQMDEETKSRLAKVISDGIEQKRGIPRLARDIKKEFADMTIYRSQMIARTETADALSQASLDRMNDMGIDGKEWVRGSDYDCEICDGNEADGVIPVNQVFSSGHMRPPGHPHCVCALAPAMLRR